MKLTEKIEDYLKKEENELVMEAGLTRKHFVDLADMMKTASTLESLKILILNWCKGMNPQFDVERFKKAAGMK